MNDQNYTQVGGDEQVKDNMKPSGKTTVKEKNMASEKVIETVKRVADAGAEKAKKVGGIVNQGLAEHGVDTAKLASSVANDVRNAGKFVAGTAHVVATKGKEAIAEIKKQGASDSEKYGVTIEEAAVAAASEVPVASEELSESPVADE